MQRPGLTWRVVVAAAIVAAAGSWAAGCGPALTVGGILGIASLQDDSRDVPNSPPSATVTTPSGVVNDVIQIAYRLTDAEAGDRADVSVEFSLDGTTFNTATQAFVEGAEGTANLVADSAGTDHVFFWNATQDLSTNNVTGVRVRVTPAATSGGTLGQAVTTNTFDVFNRFITTLAAQPSSFRLQIASVAVTSAGDLIFSDVDGHRVLKLTRSTGVVSLLAGTGTLGFKGGGVAGAEAQLNLPLSVSVQPNGDVIVADFFNFLVRRIENSTGFVQEIAGLEDDFAEGVLARDAFVLPRDLAVDEQGNAFVLSDESRIRSINLQGSGNLSFNKGTLKTNNGCVELSSFAGTSYTVGPSQIFSVISGRPGCNGPMSSAAFAAPLRSPRAIALVSKGTERTLYVLEAGFGQPNFPQISAANLGASAFTVRSLVTGTDVVVAPGDFAVIANSKQIPSGLFDFVDMVAPQEGVLVFPITRRHQVAAINVSSSAVNLAGTTLPAFSSGTIAGVGTPGLQGDGLPATSAQLQLPLSVGVDSQGTLFVGEVSGRLRVFAGSSGYTLGAFSVSAGKTGTLPVVIPNAAPAVVIPVFVVAAPDGRLFVTDADSADSRSNRVLSIAPSDGAVASILGTGSFGDGGDGALATSARIGLAGSPGLSPDGTVLCVPDLTHSRVRAVNLSSSAQTFLGVTIQPNEVETVVGVGTVTSGTTTPLGDGGIASAASLNQPSTCSFDTQGLLWIGDSGNNRIRIANPLTQSVTVLGVTIQPNQIQTVIGTGVRATPTTSGDGGPASAALLDAPGVIIGTDGNAYIVDGGDEDSGGTPNPIRVRVVNLGAQTLSFGGVSVAAGAIGGVVGSSEVRKPDGSNLGDGGSALSATFRDITGISLTPSGLLWISDGEDYRVRVVNLGAQSQLLAGVSLPVGTILTALGTGIPGFAGDPAAVASAFNAGLAGSPLEEPRGLVAYDDGRVLFVDSGNGAVRLANFSNTTQRFGGVDVASGKIGVVAGSRSGRVRAQTPGGVVVDAQNTVIFSDSGRLGSQPAVLQLDPRTRIVTRVAGRGFTIDPAPPAADVGDGGAAVLADLRNPVSVALDGAGSLYVGDAGDARIRFVNRGTASVSPSLGITVDPGAITTILNGGDGDGDTENDVGKALVGGGVDLVQPTGVSISGTSLWVADEFAPRIMRLDLSTGTVASVMSRIVVVSTRPGTLFDGSGLVGQSTAALRDNAGLLFGSTAGVTSGDLVVIPAAGLDDGEISAEVKGPPSVLIVDEDPPAATTLTNYRIERAFQPTAILAISATEAYVGMVFDDGHSEVQRVTDTGSGFTATLVAGTRLGDWNGDLNQATAMNFREIRALALDGDVLYVVDAGLHRVVAVNTGSSTQTIAGLSVGNGEARTVAGGGQGSNGFNGDAVPPNLALLSRPTGVALTTDGGVVIVDQGNGRVRRFQR
jgi:sugar lactone lactonase YvrE